VVRVNGSGADDLKEDALNLGGAVSFLSLTGRTTTSTQSENSQVE